MGLLLWESIATEQETCCVCLDLTNFPTTFPRDLTSKTSVIGIFPLSTEPAKLAPAPYNGTLLPCRLTDTVRRLFRCWWYFFNCSQHGISSIKRLFNKLSWGAYWNKVKAIYGYIISYFYKCIRTLIYSNKFWISSSKYAVVPLKPILLNQWVAVSVRN